jgi:hypothetical protein
MSADTMTFSSGTWTPAVGSTPGYWTPGNWPSGESTPPISINRPLHGYTAEIHMPIETTRDQTKAWHFFDNDSSGASDYRLCEMRLDLPADQKGLLNDFIRLDAQGRAYPFAMSIDTALTGAMTGDSADGFYPFGPDIYAVGNPAGGPVSCIVQPVNHDQGGALWQPYKWFEDKLTLLLISPTVGAGALPSNTTAGVAQGTMAIGNTTGLMFPQDGFKAKTAYNYDVGVSLAGRPSVVDLPTDYYETSFAVTANLGNAAKLVSALIGGTYGRAADVLFNVSDGYPFGADNCTGIPWNSWANYYTTRLLGAENKGHEIVLKITHESYNRFQIPLTLSLVSIT